MHQLTCCFWHCVQKTYDGTLDFDTRVENSLFHLVPLKSTYFCRNSNLPEYPPPGQITHHLFHRNHFIQYGNSKTMGHPGQSQKEINQND